MPAEETLWFASSGESDDGEYSSQGEKEEDDHATFHGIRVFDKGMTDQFEVRFCEPRSHEGTKKAGRGRNHEWTPINTKTFYGGERSVAIRGVAPFSGRGGALRC